MCHLASISKSVNPDCMNVFQRNYAHTELYKMHDFVYRDILNYILVLQKGERRNAVNKRLIKDLFEQLLWEGVN